MKKSLILAAAMVVMLGVGAAEVNIYGNFAPGSNGLPKKWAKLSKAVGTVEVINAGDKNVVTLSSEDDDKKGIGIISVAIPASHGNQFKVTATINGGPCQMEMLSYGVGMNRQIEKINKMSHETEISRVFTVKDSAKGPVKAVRFCFRVTKGDGVSVSDVKVESL